MRSKAYWGYDEEFLNQCRGELNYSADQILAPQHDFQVCLFDYQVIAFYALERIDDELVELEALFVEPKYVGAGFGRMMLEHAKSRAMTLGSRRMIIQGDPHAETFYLAVGAMPCGSRESGSIPGRELPLYEIVFASRTDQMDTSK